MLKKITRVACIASMAVALTATPALAARRATKSSKKTRASTSTSTSTSTSRPAKPTRAAGAVAPAKSPASATSSSSTKSTKNSTATWSAGNARTIKAPTSSANAWRGGRPAFAGFYINLDLGYGMTSGTKGPKIPGLVLTGGGTTAYDALVRTDRGAGFAFGFQLGYNILGYVSIGGELSWQGAGFAKGKDTEGAVAASILIGVHPLRFWRADLPVDLRLYAGYSPFDINYYYETVTDSRGSGKSWTGTSIPFGFSFSYRIPESVFVVGFDMRFAAASYQTWWYNYDKDIKYEPDPVETAFRTTPRLLLGWHF